MPRLKRTNEAPHVGIVHLGVGAFCRAHLAQYTDQAIRHSGGNWGILGISLRSARTRDALAEQGYAYTAVALGPNDTTHRQIEVFRDILVATENPGAILERMADPAVKIVSLTITEKGYCLDTSVGGLDWSHPDIQHDLEHPLPVSAPGFLVCALALRRKRGLPPFTTMSCDNLPENGRCLCQIVLDLARRIDPGLADWVAEHGRFPNTMVDRITPATTPEDKAMVEALIGARDEAPVLHEPFSQWVIEDDFVKGERPDWGRVGAELVSNVAPYEAMKLRMLNGTHSALAYLGYLAGNRTIAETVECPDFRSFVERLWQSEIIPTLSAPEGVSLTDYATKLMARYRNPNVQHQTWQIAMDGSQKLPQRILSTLEDRIALGADSPGLILTLAAWMRYVRGTDEAGASIDVRDPHAARFSDIARSTPDHDDWVASILACQDIFPGNIAHYLQGRLPAVYRDLCMHGARALVADYEMSVTA